MWVMSDVQQYVPGYNPTLASRGTNVRAENADRSESYPVPIRITGGYPGSQKKCVTDTSGQEVTEASRISISAQ